MKVRTDDDIYRARLLYLGPPGYTLPFHLPYAQLGLFAVLAGVLCFLAIVVFGSGALVGVALAAAMFLTSYIWGHVDPDKPARKVLMVAATDWRSIKPEPEKLPRLKATHIKVRENIADRHEITTGEGR